MIDIIVLSYNDDLVTNTLDSIISNETSSVVNIIVVDGGSRQEILSSISLKLRPQDMLISEKDDGIFDALNKGLSFCNSENIGWIGSDDFFSSNIDFKEINNQLNFHDLYIGRLKYFSCGFITRSVETWPLKYGLFSIGFNNPHFSTFGRYDVFKMFEFDVSHRGSDILYFQNVMHLKPKIYINKDTLVFMKEGGFSNASIKGVFRTNLDLMKSYYENNNYLLILGLPIKLIYKYINKLKFKIFLEKI